MRALITGGSGYIGSFVTRAFQTAGHDVVVLDSFENGHREAIDCPIIECDLNDRERVISELRDQGFECVVHLAAYASVGNSVKDPSSYYRNNIVASLNLLDACVQGSISYVVFSSTSEVYGDALYLPLDEEHPTNPKNPYGLSKRVVEQFLESYDRAYGLRSISLRYFNAAGAAPDGSMGEDHQPEEHLIPNAIRGALGLTEFQLTSAPVNTPDGTTIRDYVHVLDLADAHVRALELLQSGHATDAINIGTGKGYSTKEVIEAVKRATDSDFPVATGTPRPGEPPAKFASYAKAQRLMGWQPQHGLESIVTSASEWHSSHPDGYRTSAT